MQVRDNNGGGASADTNRPRRQHARRRWNRPHRWQDYSFVDSSGVFEAFPNGHRRFLTKKGLEKINRGREGAEGVPDHPLNPTESPWETESQRQHRERALLREGGGYARSRPAPYSAMARGPWGGLVGQSSFGGGGVDRALRLQQQQGRRAGPGLAPIPDPRGGVSVAEWAHFDASVGLGSEAAAGRGGFDPFEETRRCLAEAGVHSVRPRGQVARPLQGGGATPQQAGPGPQRGRKRVLGALGEEDGAGGAGRGWDTSSTLIPEIPTLTGETMDGEIKTLRLRVRQQGGVIDLWRGDTITLILSGRGPMNGESITLVVEDIVYGEMAYVNMLVDGGSALSGGGRSRSRTCAYVRVTQSG